MWERLRRFSELDTAARGVFLRAATLLPLISASLRLRGFRKTQLSLQRRSSVRSAPCGDALAAARLIARMVRAAVRSGLRHPTCLEEALTLCWLLARRGIASELRVGVRKSGERMEAHAWVECHGGALNEPEDVHENFAAFDAALCSIRTERP
jgi:hypothetical protein